MRLDVHRMLRRIEDAHGIGSGKLVQKLLAIAFLESGATRLTDRCTQGIDLEVTLADGRRLAMEVKTALAGSAKRGKGHLVTIGAKDVAGLRARAGEGFEPYFATLGARLLDEWVFAQNHGGEIQAGTYSPTHLRPYRDRDLETLVAETFPEAVVRHAGAAIDGGQGALDEVLHAYPAFAPA